MSSNPPHYDPRVCATSRTHNTGGAWLAGTGFARLLGNALSSVHRRAFIAFTEAVLQVLKGVHAGDTLYSALEIVALTLQVVTAVRALRHLRRLQQFRRPLGSTDSTADQCSPEIPGLTAPQIWPSPCPQL